MLQDYFKKMVDKATVRSMREDLKRGDYVFVLRGLSVERREKREKLGKVFWIDVRVEEAEAVDANIPPTPVGTDLDFPISLEGQYADMSAKDIKTFLVHLTGCDPSETPEQIDKLVNFVTDEGKHSKPEQPARGMIIHAGTYERVTKTGKNAGKSRVYPSWRGDFASENTTEKIAERRAKLDDKHQ